MSVEQTQSKGQTPSVGSGELVRRWLFISRMTQWDERLLLGFAWVDTHESGIYGTPVRRKYIEILIGRKGWAIGWLGYPPNNPVKHGGAQPRSCL